MTTPPGNAESSAALRALLVSDLVGSTDLVEALGDARAAEILARHDAESRALMERHGAREIDKTDGFLLLFERPVNAVWYAVHYHALLNNLSAETGVVLAARVGIHLGEVLLRQNPPDAVARGAKPLEVEGLAKPTAARLMSLAGAGQTLLSRGAYDVAQRSAVGSEDELPLEWVGHGKYDLKGVSEPVDVYEVGVRGVSPLRPPGDTDKAHRTGKRAAIRAPASTGASAPKRGGGLRVAIGTLVVLIAAALGAHYAGLWQLPEPVAGLLPTVGGGDSESAPASPPGDWASTLQDLLSRHRACEGADTCRATTANAFEAMYGAASLGNPETPPAPDEIVAHVSAGNGWTLLGGGTDAAALVRAQQLADEGQAVVAITQAGTAHVAFVIPGEMEASGSWGHDVPAAASFFHWDPGRAFVGRGLSYAFSDPGAVRLYRYGS